MIAAAREVGRRDRARLRDPVLARPSVAHRAPGVVQPAPRRDAQVRREPAQALPGHRQRQLRLGGPRRSLAGALRRRPRLGRARRHRLPRRQPAHEAGAVLGVADRRGAGAASRGDLPRRGVHPAVDDDDAREGRIRPELHVLHLEEHEGRAAASTSASSLAWSSFYRPNAFVEHAGHPPRVPAAGRPAGVRGAARAGGDALAELRHLLRLRVVRERRRCGPGSEEYLDSEKYEVKRRKLDGPLLPLVAKLNEIRRARPALQRLENIRFLETENDQLIAYAKDDVICVVNLDPFAEQAGVCVVPVSLGFAAGVRRPRSCSPASRSRGGCGRNYVKLGPGKAHVIKVGIDERSRTVVRARPAVVQDGGLLRDPPARVLRRQRRRLRRLPRPHRQARLPARDRHRLHLAAAVLSQSRSATAATTSPTSSRSIPTTGRSTTSGSSSTRRTSAASA